VRSGGKRVLDRLMYRMKEHRFWRSLWWDIFAVSGDSGSRSLPREQGRVAPQSAVWVLLLPRHLSAIPDQSVGQWAGYSDSTVSRMQDQFGDRLRVWLPRRTTTRGTPVVFGSMPNYHPCISPYHFRLRGSETGAILRQRRASSVPLMSFTPHRGPPILSASLRFEFTSAWSHMRNTSSSPVDGTIAEVCHPACEVSGWQ